jgi:hypothetical protein
MPGLSVSEKNHWKERLSKRIDKRIEAISAEDPNLLERVKRDAHDRAMQSLNLADLQAEIDRLEREEEELEKRERVLNRTMLARVRGVPIETIDELSVYQSGKHNHEVQAAITRRQAVHEDELLTESETGRRILNLRAEKDGLLDSVWLASSPKQIKDLWSKVAELLGDEPTQLQRDAMAIAPVED